MGEIWEIVDEKKIQYSNKVVNSLHKPWRVNTIDQNNISLTTFYSMLYIIKMNRGLHTNAFRDQFVHVVSVFDVIDYDPLWIIYIYVYVFI